LSVKPGETLQVAVALDIDDGWHLYGRNPGAAFLVPSTVSVEKSDFLVAGEVVAPEPHQAFDTILKQTLSTYTGRIWFRIPVTASAGAPVRSVTLALNIKTQACDKSRCLPPEATPVRILLQIDPAAPPEVRHPEIFGTSRK
ncbi:MAG: protein-disulfide reductase DsbD N-terminal domain-containing protein, partial [Verrucomicrobiota bacterium]|nr:protein-disulfide reductase DsbD N-terminal domain-containing protein [Verrucomicrobiota bacterium]